MNDWKEDVKMENKDIFSNNVSRIIIESYNLCNRKCFMCPQSLGVRKDEYEEFPDDLFWKLVCELKSIDYSRWIAFGRYHEPLLFHKLTLERIKMVHKELPLAKIMLNTNGDFINKELLFELSKSGVVELKIMCYQGKNFSDDVAEGLCNKMIQNLGLEVKKMSCTPGVITKYEIVPIGNMKIVIKSENYNNVERGCNRGGLLEGFNNYVRDIRCDVPIKNIDIDYNGYILPCNNLLSDAVSHKPYVLGNIRDMTIYDAYVKCLKSEFVKRIYSADFSCDAVCQNCSYLYDTSNLNIDYVL